MSHDPKLSVPEFTSAPQFRMSNILAPREVRGPSRPHCGRLDRHPAHDWLTNEAQLWRRTVQSCPGRITIEGGSLDTHDCGARVHPAEIRECCGRCEGTLCRGCAPCRRVS